MPVEGTYRQVGSVVIVDESGEIDFEKAATQPVGNEPIEKLLLIQKKSILQWKIVNYGTEVAQLFDYYPHFFCLSCCQRYSCSAEFLKHVLSLHNNLYSELLPQESEPISATIVIMNNFSICKGEPSR